MQYGLPPDIALLDEEGRALLAEAYASCGQERQHGPLVLADPGDVAAGRLEIELLADVAPKAAENFRALCTGERGTGKLSRKALHYKGCRFHRIVAGFCCQGGDIVRGDGSSGESVFGGKFADEKAGLVLRHDRAGLCSMANTGKNTNSSQFFFTLAAAPQCDGKHVIFGHVVAGLDLLERIGARRSQL